MGSARRTSVARGFLFADVRNYSAFVEARGDRAAADLLERFRALVRGAVADFDGAEIRTEGDSFYVAFPAASAAVECGLRILELARHGDGDPIPVGVGIHAGETVETAEGYVGSAVNIAARICSSAEAGQLLVSETVRGLVRTYLPVTFLPLGRRRLKGIAEPVALYAVAAEGTVIGVGRRRRWLIIAVAVGVAAVALAAVGALPRPGVADRQGDQAATSLPPVASATVAPSSPSVAPGGGAEQPFPDEGEAALVELVGAGARHCARADPADAPQAYIPAVGFPNPQSARLVPHLVRTDGGIECRLGGRSEPEAVWYWNVGGAFGGLDLDASGLVLNRAGYLRVPPGDCEEGDRAVDHWSLGSVEGQLLCYTNTREAALEWSYAGEDIYGRAIRGDGDLVELLRWWNENARFGP